MEIRVFKRQKILEVWENDHKLCEFPIGIGRDESGAKLKKGDHKTPEGRYRVCVKNPQSKFHLSLGLNYPNVEDARRGLAAGLIDEATYHTICEKQKSEGSSPWDTPLGGAIYIHGDLESQAWSEGCIRLLQPHIEALYCLAPIGTPVLITA